jgi:hypothetical protein
MKFNKTIAGALARALSVETRVTSDSIQEAHSDGAGADLCFVRVTLSLGEAELMNFPVVAKLRSGKRIINMPSKVGRDGQRRPDIYLTNELRAVVIRGVFADTRVAALAAKWEKELEKANQADSIDGLSDSDF